MCPSLKSDERSVSFWSVTFVVAKTFEVVLVPNRQSVVMKNASKHRSLKTGQKCSVFVWRPFLDNRFRHFSFPFVVFREGASLSPLLSLKKTGSCQCLLQVWRKSSSSTQLSCNDVEGEQVMDVPIIKSCVCPDNTSMLVVWKFDVELLAHRSAESRATRLRRWTTAAVGFKLRPLNRTVAVDCSIFSNFIAWCELKAQIKR